MYILSTGCQWRAIPKDLPPRSTLFDYLDLWSWDGMLERIHHALYVECREQEEREASPGTKSRGERGLRDIATTARQIDQPLASRTSSRRAVNDRAEAGHMPAPFLDDESSEESTCLRGRSTYVAL